MSFPLVLLIPIVMLNLTAIKSAFLDDIPYFGRQHKFYWQVHLVVIAIIVGWMIFVNAGIYEWAILVGVLTLSYGFDILCHSRSALNMFLACEKLSFGVPGLRNKKSLLVEGYIEDVCLSEIEDAKRKSEAVKVYLEILPLRELVAVDLLVLAECVVPRPMSMRRVMADVENYQAKCESVLQAISAGSGAGTLN